MPTVKMNLAAVGGLIQFSNTGNVVVPADGIVTLDSRDVPDALRLGGSYINNITKFQPLSGTPVAATAGRIVASVALANGTLTIAHQPDVPRQVNLRVDPGTTAISAGNAALTYVANDGSTQVDNLSLVAPASTPVTTSSTKGVVSLTSAILTVVTGGTSPLVQIDDTNSMALFVDPGYQDFKVVQAFVDGAVIGTSAVASSAAAATPSTAPNGTHTYGFAYNYNMPNT